MLLPSGAPAAGWSVTGPVHPFGPTGEDGPVDLARWLTVLGTAAGLLVLSWAVLVLLARRLPPGPARELARFLPACATAVRRLRRHPAVPRRARVVLLLAGLWVLSPIDLIPEFLPVIGPLDDVVVVALALRYAARRVPREVLLAAWPGDDRVLLRLLGPAPPPVAGEPGRV
jgi:uncharacterized membrane protein YkvA (DUF1232 family)